MFVQRKARGWFVSTLAIAGVLLGAASARAGVDGDVRGGFNADTEDAFVGGGVLTNLGSTTRWFFNPNAEVAFSDDRDQLQLSGDVHYDFNVSPSMSYWLGAGPTLVHRDANRGSDDTDLGVNLLAGVGARSGNVRPFAQGKVVLKDDSEAAVAVGIRF